MIKIQKYSEITPSEVLARNTSSAGISDTVADIIKSVREKGDKALYEYGERFDGVKLKCLEVSPEEIEEALKTVEPEFLNILRRSAHNITEFHKRQVRNSFVINENKGVVVGQKITPIEKVGLYVPGGTAAYPSTVLMDSIPAKIAGCREIIMVTPPSKNGSVNPVILAAAKIAGIDRIFKVGGAQAIAALAYGTESIPNVYKIVGPGNAYVAEAKRQVFGRVSIDMIAGPSEILIISDGSSDPEHTAADLLSQAEHDKMAGAVLVTPDENFASAVSEGLERQIPLLPRADIARTSIDTNGRIIITDSIEQAIEIANEIAPEHLELCVDNPFDYLDSIRCAGSVFLGKNCPEALGDYCAGPNHTLPTEGTAKFASPLSVDDFIKKTQFTYYSEEAFRDIAHDVAAFAEREGLFAHANSALVRLKKNK